MKHVSSVSKSQPAKATLFGHPDPFESIGDFLKDPLGILWTHVEGIWDFLFGWI